MSKKGILSAIISGCLLVGLASGAQAQSPPAAPASAPKGPFDGRWNGESLRCSPAASTGSFGGLNIRNNQIDFNWTRDGRRETCSAPINADGTFENKTCPLKLSGKFGAKKAEVNFTNGAAFCTATAVRP